MPLYQFNIEGKTTETIYENRPSDASARSYAGTLAKRNDCPVDLARAGPDYSDADWNDRYMTTANPETAWKSGVRFERLDG